MVHSRQVTQDSQEKTWITVLLEKTWITVLLLSREGEGDRVCEREREILTMIVLAWRID